MKVQDVMTSPAHSTCPEVSVASAARTMADYGCGALPVLDNAGRPIGILTNRDVRRAVAVGDLGRPMKVSEAMTLEPVTCSAETPLAEALKILSEREIQHLPVVDIQGRLVGIVSLSDIVAATHRATMFRISEPVLDQARN